MIRVRSTVMRKTLAILAVHLVLFTSQKGHSYEQSDPESRAVKSAPRIGGCLPFRKRVAVPSAVHPCVSLNRAAAWGGKHL